MKKNEKNKKKAKKGQKQGILLLNNRVRGGVKKRDEKSFKIAKGAKKSVEIDITS